MMRTHLSTRCWFLALLAVGAAAGLPAAETTQPPPGELAAKLEKRLSFDWESMALSDALRDVGAKSGIKLELVDEDEPEIRERYRHKVHMVLYEVRTRDILEMLCAMPGLGVELRGEVVRIVKSGRVAAEMEIYEVGDLVLRPPSQPESAGRIIRSIQDAELTDDARNPFVNAAAEGSGITPANVADMIRAHVEPDSWDPARGTSIEERDGRLVVMQSPRVHELIRRQLAEFRSRLFRRVELDVRLLQVHSSDLEALVQGARSRGTPQGLLDRVAIERLDKLIRQNTAQRVYSGSATLGVAQSSVLRQTRQRRFVSTYNAGGSQLEPVIENVGLGTSIWLCPWLGSDGRNLRLGLRAEWQELASEPQPVQVLRGGRIVSKNGKQTVSIKRKPAQPAAPNAQGPAAPNAQGPAAPNAQGPAAPPAVPANGGEKAELKDVTDEYEINIEDQLPEQTVSESLQVYLPTLARSGVRLDLEMPADAYAYASLPATSTEGPKPGDEFLVVVRGHPLLPACPSKRQTAPPKPPAYPAEIEARLARDVEMRFDGVKLGKALSDFGDKTGVSIAIDYEKAEGVGERAITWAGGPVPAAKVLSEILRQAGCEVRAFESVLLVRSVQPVQPAPPLVELGIYDVLDMAANFNDACLPVFPSLENRTNAAGVNVVMASSSPGLAAPDLAMLLKERLMPERFSDPSTSIEEQGGRLVVMQTPEGLEMLARHLEVLRRKFMTPVYLTARWMTVEEEDLGHEVPASLDGPRTARILEVLNRSGTRLLSTTRLAAYPGQRIHALGALTASQVAGYTLSDAQFTPDLPLAVDGSGYEFRVAAQNEGRLPGAVDELSVELRSFLSTFGPPASLQDPLVPEQEKSRWPSSNAAAMPGLIHSAAGCQTSVETMLHIPDGGAVVMRYSVPDWLRGEPVDPAKRAKRALILLVQAERRK